MHNQFSWLIVGCSDHAGPCLSYFHCSGENEGVTSHLFLRAMPCRDSTCEPVLSLPNSHTYKDKFNYSQSACKSLMNEVVKLKFLDLHDLHQLFMEQ